MNEINNFDMKNIFYSISKKYILPKFNNLQESDFKRKKDNSIVTSVDIIVEKKLKESLNKILPSSNFIGEELYEKDPSILLLYNDNKYCWTVDPIDGTKNFSIGKTKFAIMVALTFKKTIIQSWIYEPLTEKMCYGINGQGVFINDNSLKSSNNINIENSKGSISSKYWTDKYINKIIQIKNNFSEVSSYGCIGLEYLDIAKGKRDFAIISKISPWDHIAGILMTRESGAFDQYFDNGSYNFQLVKNNLVVASNKILGNKILSLIME